MSQVAEHSCSKNGNNENSWGLHGARWSRCLTESDLPRPGKASRFLCHWNLSPCALSSALEAGPNPIFRVATASFCTISF